MIVKISGILEEKKDSAVIINVNGLSYEVIVPGSVLQRIDETKDDNGHVHLMTYHYYQMSPSSGVPTIIGFTNEVEREFFQQFIKVSGIGPRAAVKALNKPISEITQAINDGNVAYLTTLAGIGKQRAKEIVAKLQGRVDRFCLIQDKEVHIPERITEESWQQEALDVLLQLQYKKSEAEGMIHKALDASESIRTTEELLNQIYKQKIQV